MDISNVAKVNEVKVGEESEGVSSTTNLVPASNSLIIAPEEVKKEKIKIVITRKDIVKQEIKIIPKVEAEEESSEENEEITEEMKDTERSRYFCYILKNKVQSEIKKTYNGFTVDLRRRIRQHNSEIKGGAKYTTSNGNKTWHYYAVLTGFDTAVSALSCEWWIKHPTGHRKRPMKFSGPRGRILGLQKVAEDVRFKGYDKALEYTLWIDRSYLSLLNPKTIKPNIKIMTFTQMEDIIDYYLNLM